MGSKVYVSGFFSVGPDDTTETRDERSQNLSVAARAWMGVLAHTLPQCREDQKGCG